ncbi:hypothetical protein ColTof3_11790 [Colletotrichum tofieldiae]|nr:hypothetical protein ColTof3_11790 [Colletotrichum tofieldiae]
MRRWAVALVQLLGVVSCVSFPPVLVFSPLILFLRQGRSSSSIARGIVIRSTPTQQEQQKQQQQQQQQQQLERATAVQLG